MPRFFLIDAWLADAKGHNYQYALDVGAAAEERGYEPVLAVRRNLSSEIQFPASWQVERPFQYGDSPRHWLGLYGRNPHPCEVSGKWLADPRIRWWERWLGIPAELDRRRQIRRFASDCARLFAKMPPRGNDILFLPSLTEFDLLCATQFWRNEAWTRDFDWHLQFHFNFYLGRDPEFAGQAHVLRDFQRQFRSAVDQIPEHRLHFYATSDAIARQYNSLGIAIFHPLPYPVRSLRDVDRRISDAEGDHGVVAETTDRALRVTLPGALRHEKGKKQIGQLIDSVWDEFLAPGKIQFVFQSTPKSLTQRLPSRLRGSLQDGTLQIRPMQAEGPPSPLVTVPHPLDAKAYADLIRGSEIGLFVYDARRYFARVSGVLCEMLSAGVPVIVPVGCWLADQIAEENYRHVDMLWRANRAASQEIRLNSDSRMLVSLPAKAQSLLLRFDWPSMAAPGSYVEVAAEPSVDGKVVSGPPLREILGPRDQGSPGVVLRFPQPVTAVRVSFQSAFGADGASPSRARLLPLPWSPRTIDPPRARVGLIAADERDIPNLLQEMISHYSHYLHTAREFAGLWQCQHSPALTVEALAARTRLGSVEDSRSMVLGATLRR